MQRVTQASELSLEKNTLDMLNLLRVMATMFVFLLHGRSAVWGIDEAGPILSIFTNFPAWAGVWILFFLSGYLMQKGFLKGRYPIFEENKLNKKELGRFYLKRFLKIAPAYYIYIFLFLLLRYDMFFFKSPLVALKILTFTFNGNGGISGIGHLWYISLAMWLYLLAPFFYWMIRKIQRVPTLITTILLLTAAGFAYRLAIHFSPASWYTWSYTFLPANFDLFVGGMLCCSLTEAFKGKITGVSAKICKPLSLVLLVALALYNCYVYGVATDACYFIYKIVLPTFYVWVCGFLLVSFDSCTKKRSKPTFSAIRKNPLRLIDRFSPLTYSFYIFHIVVLNYFELLLPSWRFFANASVAVRYVLYFGICFIVSLAFAIVFEKMISGFSAAKKRTA